MTLDSGARFVGGDRRATRRAVVALFATIALLITTSPIAEAQPSAKYVTNHAVVHTGPGNYDTSIDKGVVAEWWVMVKEPTSEDRNACNGLDDSVECVYFPMMNIFMDATAPRTTAIHIGPQLANNGDDEFGEQWIINYGFYINGSGHQRQWYEGTQDAVPVGKWVRYRMVKVDETYYPGEGWESTWRVTIKHGGTVTVLGKVGLPGRYFTGLTASYETIEFDGGACISSAPDVRYRVARYKVETGPDTTAWKRVYGVKAKYSGVDNDDSLCWRDEWRLTGKNKGKFNMIRYDSDPARAIQHDDWIWKCDPNGLPACP